MPAPFGPQYSQTWWRRLGGGTANEDIPVAGLLWNSQVTCRPEQLPIGAVVVVIVDLERIRPRELIGGAPFFRRRAPYGFEPCVCQGRAQLEDFAAHIRHRHPHRSAGRSPTDTPLDHTDGHSHLPLRRRKNRRALVRQRPLGPAYAQVQPCRVGWFGLNSYSGEPGSE